MSEPTPEALKVYTLWLAGAFLVAIVASVMVYLVSVKAATYVCYYGKQAPSIGARYTLGNVLTEDQVKAFGLKCQESDDPYSFECPPIFGVDNETKFLETRTYTRGEMDRLSGGEGSG